MLQFGDSAAQTAASVNMPPLHSGLGLAKVSAWDFSWAAVMWPMRHDELTWLDCQTRAG